ncbi:10179_t:CDS:2, partial [Entrophospora sp. SA101]
MNHHYKVWIFIKLFFLEDVTDHFDEFSPESGSNQIDLTQGLDYDLKQLVLNIMNNDLNYEDFEENNFERNNLEENDFGENDFGDLNPRNSEGENLDNILEQPKAKSKNRPKIIPKKNNLCGESSKKKKQIFFCAKFSYH